jgi:SecD/SecF fusion protein
VVLIAIAIFGGEVIRGFSIALIIGIVIGAYSSVLLATPVLFDMYMRAKEKRVVETVKTNK